jgi:ribonuclease P protein component
MKLGRATSALLQSVAIKPKKRLSSVFFSFSYVQNQGNTAYITVSVSKKVAPLSVDRNRAKRRVREAITWASPTLTSPIIGVISLNKAVFTASFGDIKAEMTRMFSAIA